jgi:limonene-1,2-epoxide hydrolase
MEKPIDVVSRFCAAWADDLSAEDLAAFFTDDAVYHNIPFEPVTGREGIAENIASFIRPGPPGIERIEFRVINIAASGPVVMTERVDAFTLAQDFRAASHGDLRGQRRQDQRLAGLLRPEPVQQPDPTRLNLFSENGQPRGEAKNEAPRVRGPCVRRAV